MGSGRINITQDRMDLRSLYWGGFFQSEDIVTTVYWSAILPHIRIFIRHHLGKYSPIRLLNGLKRKSCYLIR